MISPADILNARILIVDDKDTNIALLEQTLRDAGYTSVSATMNPCEVCDLHRENHYALILLDLQMPGQNGFEVMECLKTIETGSYLPVLAQTAQPNHMVQALKAGAKDFVSKPFYLSEVLVRVHNMIEIRLLHEEAHKRTEQAERSEKTMHASELSYRRLFEAAQEGILILDGDTGWITDVNPFLLRLVAFPHSEMVGRTIEQVGLFMDTAPNQTILQQIKKEHGGCYDDLLLNTKDGRKMAVEVIENCYEVGGKRVIQYTIRDITERKYAKEEISRLNQALEQRVSERTIELEKVNSELQAFSYSVSHDLRAPLRHVSGFVDLLTKELGPAVSERTFEYLTTISEAATRMGKLIDDLLAFARIGQASVQKRVVDLNDLVQETLRDFRGETVTRKIEWDVHPLTSVWADRALMQMVLTNLISNAVKFTSARTDAKIEIGSTCSEKGETVTFVRDNGAGFNPKHTEKLFGVFQRLHSQSEFEGTGIGLANVQRIVHRHGGRAWGEGLVDGGATFYFSVPNQGETE